MYPHTYLLGHFRNNIDRFLRLESVKKFTRNSFVGNSFIYHAKEDINNRITQLCFIVHLEAPFLGKTPPSSLCKHPVRKVEKR